MRRGFTLVEVLIALVIFAIVGTIATVMLHALASSTARSTRALLVDRTTGSLRLFLDQELRDAGDSDVALPAPATLALRRGIGDASVCLATDSTVVFARAAWQGTRDPQAVRDEAWLLVGAPDSATWHTTQVGDVSADRCPGDSLPAIRLAVTGGNGATIVRVMEPVEVQAYHAGSDDWFGLIPASHASPVQPFAGPLESGATSFTRASAVLITTFRPHGFAPYIVRVPLDSP